jgi:hypothetical protein
VSSVYSSLLLSHDAMKGGPKAALPAFVTASLLCSMLQYGWNEISVQRLKIISRRTVKESLADHHESNAGTLSREELWKEAKSVRASFSQFWDNLLPRKLSDEEYAARLKAREEHLKRLQKSKEEEGKVAKS